MNRTVRTSVGIVALVATLVLGLAVSGAVLAKDAKPTAESFRADMRKLWEDHIVWTRQYIVSAATQAEDLADIGPTADRLFRNQADIGNAIAAFYGREAGDQLTALLTDHIAIAARAITEAKAANKAGLDAALADWYANADDIGDFLGAANPQDWPADMMRAHMRDHLDLTLAEAVARLDGRYADDVAAYDAIHAQILQMADMLANGIVAQFPNRFNR